MKRIVAAIVAACCLSLPAVAAEEKKKPKGDGNFDDLFGAPPKKDTGNLDAMKKASEGVGKGTTGPALAPKTDASTPSGDNTVKLLNAFAALRIDQDKKLGCQPSGRDKKKILTWSFNEVPAKGQPFDVCLQLASKSGREMNMSIAIVDARNERVAKAEDVVDFRGRPKIDHILSYPAPVFKNAGQYFYVVDLDGKEAGRLPLFVLKVDDNVESPSSGAQGSSSSSSGSLSETTAKEPDGT